MKQKILITLNDQGGSQISCEKHEISPCLRAQDHGHPPIVVYETVWCIGNGQVHDALQMEKERCKTLNCMADPMKILIVRNHEN